MKHDDLVYVRNYVGQLCLNAISDDGTTEDQAYLSHNTGEQVAEKRPVVHPYGFVSIAPAGINCVIQQIGDNPGARAIIGFRDAARKTKIYLSDGDSEMYSSDGESVICSRDKVQLGSFLADNPIVLGTELLDLLGQIIDLLKAGNTALTTSPGNPTAPNPAITPVLDYIKTKYIEMSATNIVSQHVFSERIRLI